ncbi:MAG TPA: mechanosensitive ion channel domain-containing protein [Nitrospira sp.]|nr:mechanosensitive ion channel domain-containing protein [Nitrospira sp.]
MRSRDLMKIVTFVVILACATAALAAPSARKNGPPEAPSQELYFIVDDLQQGTPDRDEPVIFQTPRAAVEHFLANSREGDFKHAAESLNLSLIPREERGPFASSLAEKFYYVMVQRLRINFHDIPDNPDGEIDSADDPSNPLAGKPRRSIKIGSIGLNLWDVEIRVERFKGGDRPPTWLFSPRTVESIDRMYKIHGPGPFMKYLPSAMRVGLMNNSPSWHWGTVITAATLAAMCGWLIQRFTVEILKRIKSAHVAALIEAASGPLALIAAAALLHLALFSLLSVSGPIVSIQPILEALIVIATTWFGLRAIREFSNLASFAYLEKISSEEGGNARSRLTRLSVVRQILSFVALALGLGFALRQLNVFETFSLSLLASAGVASVILGIAAQSVLGNIMAGIQIALSQPACIGDSICFEGHWGTVEEITHTYITIRTWDARRVVIPLSYFIAHPFENWSMKSAQTIQPIYLYVDYKTDVDAVRTKFKELVKACEDWDDQMEPVVEVTDLKNGTMELRALCGAKDPPRAWRVHCRLREELVAFVRELQGGRFLPRQRLALVQEQGRQGQPHVPQAKEPDTVKVQ